MDNNRIREFFALFIAFGVSIHGSTSKFQIISFLLLGAYLLEEHVQLFVHVFYQDYSQLHYPAIIGHILLASTKSTQMVIAWQTILNRRGERQIFVELTRIDDTVVCALFHWIDFKQCRRAILWNALPTTIISFLMLFIHLGISMFWLETSVVDFMSHATSTAIRMRYIQYVYMLTLVREKLKILKCVLLENCGRELRIDQVYKMKDVFHAITSVCGLINDVYGLSILFMVIASVSQFVWILHWLVLTLENSTDVAIIAKVSIVIISECLGLTMTCKLGQDCESVCKELSRILARMDSQSFEISHSLEDFALQVMHDPVRFTANGFFGLNFQTFAGMIVMAITQLFVLLQFSKIGTPYDK